MTGGPVPSLVARVRNWVGRDLRADNQFPLLLSPYRQTGATGG